MNNTEFLNQTVTKSPEEPPCLVYLLSKDSYNHGTFASTMAYILQLIPLEKKLAKNVLYDYILRYNTFYATEQKLSCKEDVEKFLDTAKDFSCPYETCKDFFDTICGNDTQICFSCKYAAKSVQDHYNNIRTILSYLIASEDASSECQKFKQALPEINFPYFLGNYFQNYKPEMPFKKPLYFPLYSDLFTVLTTTYSSKYYSHYKNLSPEQRAKELLMTIKLRDSKQTKPIYQELNYNTELILYNELYSLTQKTPSKQTYKTILNYFFKSKTSYTMVFDREDSICYFHEIHDSSFFSDLNLRSLENYKEITFFENIMLYSNILSLELIHTADKFQLVLFEGISQIYFIIPIEQTIGFPILLKYLTDKNVKKVSLCPYLIIAFIHNLYPSLLLRGFVSLIQECNYTWDTSPELTVRKNIPNNFPSNFIEAMKYYPLMFRQACKKQIYKNTEFTSILGSNYLLPEHKRLFSLTSNGIQFLENKSYLSHFNTYHYIFKYENGKLPLEFILEFLNCFYELVGENRQFFFLTNIDREKFSLLEATIYHEFFYEYLHVSLIHTQEKFKIPYILLHVFQVNPLDYK